MPKNVPYNTAIATSFATSPAIPTNRFQANRFNQIVRMAVQLAGTPFSTQAAMMLKANWDSKIAATDNTRIILSPPFSGSKISSSKALQTGIDTNASYEGLPVYFGEGTSEFTAQFLDTDAAVLDAFFSTVSAFSMMNQGVTANSLVVYLVNNDGMIFSTPTWGGLPCINLASRTRETAGLNSSDMNMFSFYLPPNWDGGATLPTPTVPVGGGSVDLRSYAW